MPITVHMLPLNNMLRLTMSPPTIKNLDLHCFRTNSIGEGEGEGEVAFFSAKRWDRRNRADLIESATPCHDAQVMGLYRDSNPLRLTVLAAMSEDYTTAPQHLQFPCGTKMFSFASKTAALTAALTAKEIFPRAVHDFWLSCLRNVCSFFYCKICFEWACQDI